MAISKMKTTISVCIKVGMIFGLQWASADTLNDELTRLSTTSTRLGFAPILTAIENKRDFSGVELSILSSTLFKEGKFHEAEENAHRALQMNPDLHPANRVLALISFNRRDFEEALAYIDNALKVQPQRSDYLTIKIGILIRMKKFEDADQEIAIFKKISPSDALFSEAILLEAKGEHGASISVFRNLLDEESFQLLAQYNLVRILATAEHVDSKGKEEIEDLTWQLFAQTQSDVNDRVTLPLFYFVIACGRAAQGEFELAEAYALESLRLYDSVSFIEVNRSVIQEALVKFQNKKRFIKTVWP